LWEHCKKYYSKWTFGCWCRRTFDVSPYAWCFSSSWEILFVKKWDVSSKYHFLLQTKIPHWATCMI
jgi:hypothetical protein